MRRFHAIAYQVAICELGTLSRWALPQHQDHVHRTSSAATFGTPQPQEVRLLRTKQRLQPELMRWPHPADDEVAGLHVKDVPKERPFVSPRPSTSKDAPPPGTVCGLVGGCSAWMAWSSLIPRWVLGD